jgi:hypothetical protein
LVKTHLTESSSWEQDHILTQLNYFDPHTSSLPPNDYV